MSMHSLLAPTPGAGRPPLPAARARGGGDPGGRAGRAGEGRPAGAAVLLLARRTGTGAGPLPAPSLPPSLLPQGRGTSGKEAGSLPPKRRPASGGHGHGGEGRRGRNVEREEDGTECREGLGRPAGSLSRGKGGEWRPVAAGEAVPALPGTAARRSGRAHLAQVSGQEGRLLFPSLFCLRSRTQVASSEVYAQVSRRWNLASLSPGASLLRC